MLNSFGSDQKVPAASADQSTEQPTTPAAAARSERSRASDAVCPACGSAEVFPAHRLMILERALASADLKTYRCYRCRQRFISLFGLQLARPENE